MFGGGEMIMWAIKGPYGGLLRWSIMDKRASAINEFENSQFYHWREAKKMGYRAVKVNVEEVK